MRFPAGCGEPYLLYISDGSASISLLRDQRKIPLIFNRGQKIVAKSGQAAKESISGQKIRLIYGQLRCPILRKDLSQPEDKE